MFVLTCRHVEGKQGYDNGTTGHTSETLQTTLFIDDREVANLQLRTHTNTESGGAWLYNDCTLYTYV